MRFYAGRRPLFFETLYVFERKLFRHRVFLRLPCARRSRDASEDDDVQKRVSHEPIRSVNAAGCFACDEEVSDIRFALPVDLDPAVLILQGVGDEDRIEPDIKLIFL